MLKLHHLSSRTLRRALIALWLPIVVWSVWVAYHAPGPISAAALSLSGRRAAFWRWRPSGQSCLEVWSLGEAPTPLASVPFKPYVGSVAFLDDDHLAVSSESQISVIEIATGDNVWATRTAPYVNLSAAPGRFAYGGFGHITLVDSDTFEFLHSWSCNGASVVQLSHDGRMLAIADAAMTIIYDTDHPKDELAAHTHQGYQVAQFASNGEEYVSVEWKNNGQVTLARHNIRQADVTKHPVPGLNEYLLFVTPDGAAFSNTTGGRPSFVRFDTGESNQLKHWPERFSYSDSHYNLPFVLVGMENGDAYLLDTPSGDILFQFPQSQRVLVAAVWAIWCVAWFTTPAAGRRWGVAFDLAATTLPTIAYLTLAVQYDGRANASDFEQLFLWGIFASLFGALLYWSVLGLGTWTARLPGVIAGVAVIWGLATVGADWLTAELVIAATLIITLMLTVAFVTRWRSGWRLQNSANGRAPETIRAGQWRLRDVILLIASCAMLVRVAMFADLSLLLLMDPSELPSLVADCLIVVFSASVAMLLILPLSMTLKQRLLVGVPLLVCWTLIVSLFDVVAPEINDIVNWSWHRGFAISTGCCSTAVTLILHRCGYRLAAQKTAPDESLSIALENAG